MSLHSQRLKYLQWIYFVFDHCTYYFRAFVESAWMRMRAKLRLRNKKKRKNKLFTAKLYNKLSNGNCFLDDVMIFWVFFVVCLFVCLFFMSCLLFSLTQGSFFYIFLPFFFCFYLKVKVVEGNILYIVSLSQFSIFASSLDLSFYTTYSTTNSLTLSSLSPLIYIYIYIYIHIYIYWSEKVIKKTMEYRIAFCYRIPVCIFVFLFFINNVSRIDGCSSFVDVPRIVTIMGLYTHAQVWLANRWRPMAEVEL